MSAWLGRFNLPGGRSIADLGQKKTGRKKLGPGGGFYLTLTLKRMGSVNQPALIGWVEVSGCNPLATQFIIVSVGKPN